MYAINVTICEGLSGVSLQVREAWFNPYCAYAYICVCVILEMHIYSNILYNNYNDNNSYNYYKHQWYVGVHVYLMTDRL